MSDATAAPESVRFLSLNIFLRPPGIKSHGGDHKWSRCERFTNEILSSYDVIALQECFSFQTSRRDYIIKKAKEAGFGYHAASPPGGWFKLRVDGGLLLLSRYPIVATEILTFPRGVHSDWLAAKGVIYAKISIGESRHMHVFTTHLQASYGGRQPINSPSVIVRMSQLQQAKAFLDSSLAKHRPEHSGEPVIFAGDFNVNGRASKSDGKTHSEEYERMIDILSGSASANGNRYHIRDLEYEANGEHPITTGTLYEGTVKASRSSLDYIFELRKLADGEDGERKVEFGNTRVEKFPVDKEPYTNLSDHFGVSTVIKYITN